LVQGVKKTKGRGPTVAKNAERGGGRGKVKTLEDVVARKISGKK